MDENEKTTKQPEQGDDEYGNGILDMSNGTQAGIAAGFVGLPILAGAAEFLHLGFSGIVIGALGAGTLALVGKHVIDKQAAHGQRPKLPFFEQLRSANWGALLTSGEEDEEQRSVPTLPLPETELEPSAPEPPQHELVFPRSPVDETLGLGRVASSGQRFDPHIDTLNGEGLIVAGTQGAGKSNVAALIGEAAGRCNMPTVIFDLKREYHTLIDVVPNGLRAGHVSIQHDVGPGYFVLDEESAADFVHEVMSNGYQAIVDLPSYGDSLEESARVITAVVNGLMNWSQAQRPEDRIPCLVMLDEAHWFLPQRQELSPTISRDTLNALMSAFFRIVNTGRSYGFTMCFFTQSIANLQKWAIKNCKRKVIMMHAEKNDLDRCEEEVDSSIATRQEIATLNPGTGIVIGFTKEPVIVQFDRRQSRHDSHTPKIERVKRFKHMRQATRPEPLSVHRNHFSGTVPVTPELVEQEKHTEPSVPVAPAVVPQVRYIDRAVAAYNAGHNSVRKLAVALHTTTYEANKLIAEMKRRRLIEWREREVV